MPETSTFAVSQGSELTSRKKFLNGQADVSGNPPQQYWRNVLPFMEGDRGLSPINMAILTMGPSLTDFGETEFFKNGNELSRF